MAIGLHAMGHVTPPLYGSLTTALWRRQLAAKHINLSKAWVCPYSSQVAAAAVAAAAKMLVVGLQALAASVRIA